MLMFAREIRMDDLSSQHRETFVDEAGKSMDLSPEPITLDEIIACLKRVRKSINRWHRRGGHQGYLTFVDQYRLFGISRGKAIYGGTPIKRSGDSPQGQGKGVEIEL